MSENKTKPTHADVMSFLQAVEQPRRREDGLALLEMMNRITGMKPVLWGPSLVGYGEYYYKTGAGREGLWPLTGFSPRKAAMTVYIMPGFKKYTDHLARLGKHKHSVSCLYITRLANVDLAVLEELISLSVERMKTLYPQWKPFPDID